MPTVPEAGSIRRWSPTTITSRRPERSSITLIPNPPSRAAMAISLAWSRLAPTAVGGGHEPYIGGARREECAEHSGWPSGNADSGTGHPSCSAAFARYNSIRSVVQVATPQPKQSVSSVQIGQSSASAAARMGQSSSSRRAIR